MFVSSLTMTKYLTKDRYEELKGQLEELKNAGRRDVAARLKHAKSLGDLSENSEYQEARDAQSSLERRIRELEVLLKTAEVIQRGEAGDSVGIGCKVTLKRNGEEVQFTIVGSNEARPVEGLISNESPIGKALLEKKVGDTAEVVTPKGTMQCEILKIE